MLYVWGIVWSYKDYTINVSYQRKKGTCGGGIKNLYNDIQILYFLKIVTSNLELQIYSSSKEIKTCLNNLTIKKFVESAEIK